MNIEAMLMLLTKLGFPMAVAIWLLYRVDNLMVSWTDAQVQIAISQAKIAVLLEQLVQLHR